MASTNNNVGQNQVVAKLQDDIQFDLAPTAGVATNDVLTGQAYTPADLKAIILARAATYREDGSAFVIADDLVEVEVDLKPFNGRGKNEGTGPILTATTATAIYKNNGSETVLDAGGGRQDGEEMTTVLPTSFDELFVENGSIVTVHVTFQKA